MTNIAQLCPKDLKDHIVSRLLAAYEDVDRKDEIYIARRSRPKDVHYVDMMLFGCSKDRVIEEWIRIVREHSGCDKVWYGASIGRFAIEVPLEEEDAIRPSAEACLPGFVSYYETIEAYQEYPTLYKKGDTDKPHAMVSWYTTDSRGCYRLVAANISVAQLQKEFGEVFLSNAVSNDYLEKLSNYQRGCLHGWLQSVNLFLGYESRMDEIPGTVDEPPAFIVDLLPKQYLEDLERENTLRYPHGEREFKNTVFLIEGDSHDFWRDHALEAYHPERKSTFWDTRRFSWRQHGQGWSESVAINEDGVHTRVNIFWNWVNEQFLGFYEMSGPDNWPAVNAWLDEHFPGIPRSDRFEDAFPVLEKGKQLASV